MVVLKKIKASTLMETLVATVLIVIVFMISSMILNNLFSNSIKNSTRAIDAYLNELEYLYQNDKLTLPYHDEFNLWDISISSLKENGKTVVVFDVVNRNINKTIERKTLEN
jgi:predicted PurR-regulated permease PerM